MKKVLHLLLCLLLLGAILPVSVFADMGPKPTITIQFNGVSDRTYYVTLLSPTDSGLYSIVDEEYLAEIRANPASIDRADIFLKMAAYQDPDGYRFLGRFEDCSETHSFSWNYCPPTKFKILLYFPDSDQFIISPPCERYTFRSFFTADVRGDGQSADSADENAIHIKKSFHYVDEGILLIIRMSLTIFLEIMVAIAFHLDKWPLIQCIIYTNILTQIMMNIVLSTVSLRMGELRLTLLAELGVFLIEAVLYTLCFPKRSTRKVPIWKPAVYALAANAASFLIGIYLTNRLFCFLY